MEVQLTPEVQAKLDQLSGETGRAQDEFVQDALAGYLDELAQVRGMLDSRYDDLQTGRVALIPRDEIVAHFHEKSVARRS